VTPDKGKHDEGVPTSSRDIFMNKSDLYEINKQAPMSVNVNI